MDEQTEGTEGVEETPVEPLVEGDEPEAEGATDDDTAAGENAGDEDDGA